MRAGARHPAIRGIWPQTAGPLSQRTHRRLRVWEVRSSVLLSVVAGDVCFDFLQSNIEDDCSKKVTVIIAI